MSNIITVDSASGVIKIQDDPVNPGESGVHDLFLDSNTLGTFYIASYNSSGSIYNLVSPATQGVLFVVTDSDGNLKMAGDSVRGASLLPQTLITVYNDSTTTLLSEKYNVLVKLRPHPSTDYSFKRGNYLLARYNAAVTSASFTAAIDVDTGSGQGTITAPAIEVLSSFPSDTRWITVNGSVDNDGLYEVASISSLTVTTNGLIRGSDQGSDAGVTIGAVSPGDFSIIMKGNFTVNDRLPSKVGVAGAPA